MGKFQVQVYKCYHLTVRASSTVSSKEVDWVDAGQKFTSSKQANGWMYIDEKKGWSNGKYLKVIKNLGTPPKTTNKDKDDKDKKNKGKTTSAKDKQNQKDFNNAASGGAKGIDFDMNDSGLSPERTRRLKKEEDANFTVENGPKLQSIYRDEPFEFRDGQSVTNPPNATDDQTTTDQAARGASAFTASANSNLNNAKRTSGVTNFANDYTEFEKNLIKMKRAQGIIDHDEHTLNWHQYHSFNRFRIDFPDSVLARTTSHVFFTRPALNILTNDALKLRSTLAYDPFWTSIHATNPSALKALTSHWSGAHDFMPILSNYARTFEIPDEILKTAEHGESLLGHKMNYGLNNIESSTAGTFNVQYVEDPYYNIYTIHKAWVEYISQVSHGKITINPKHRYLKILDYASSAYYFLCAADGETILYWAKYFGVFPTSVPASGASWTKGTPSKIMQYDVNYAYSMKEEYYVSSLYEFNRLKNTQAGASGKFEYERSYVPESRFAPKAFAGVPFVQSIMEDGKRVYKLRYRK